MFFRIVFIIIIGFVGTAPIIAENEELDFARFANLQERTRNKVVFVNVKPTWFDDGTRFWYRRDLGKNDRAFIVVDPLIKADKDFDLIVVPGAGHGVGETKYMKRRRAQFFVRHLKKEQ